MKFIILCSQSFKFLRPKHHWIPKLLCLVRGGGGEYQRQDEGRLLDFHQLMEFGVAVRNESATGLKNHLNL